MSKTDPWIIILADTRRPLQVLDGKLMLATITEDKNTGVWSTGATRYETEAEAQEEIHLDSHPDALDTMRLSAWVTMKMGRRKPPQTETSHAK